MKRSKQVAIGLLALSLASCQSNRKKPKDDYQNGNPNYYLDNGNGYQHGGVSPMWVYWAYSMGRNGQYQSSPAYVYRSRSGHFHSTYMGESKTMTASHFSKSGMAKSGAARGGISRGGFGHSGSHSVSS